MRRIEYICEACGASVRPGIPVCPECYGLFSGIKCPKCNMEGNDKTFRNGCPHCGYLAKKIPLALVDGSGISRQNIQQNRGWPASRYWLLSGITMLTLTTVFYLWFNS